ncbi:MAG: radical SAM protein [Thermoanaerobaculia bacterium]
MKILLIEPAKAPLTLGGEDVFLFEPLALEYLAAGLVGDHDVRIHDQRLDHDVKAVFDEFQPDVVGVTAYTVHVSVVRELCKKIKSWNPEVLTVVGGHHATVAPEDFLSPFIDVVVSGEGVFPFREIVRRREHREGLTGIPGVAMAMGERGVGVDGPGDIDLDAFPFPDRSLTAAYRGEYYSEYMKPLASIRASKGCPYRCNFCALWKLAGGHYFRRKPESVVEELAAIDEEFIFFADDESLLDYGRMKKLAHLIEEAKLDKRYFLYGRSDTVARHPDLVEMWRDVGLERLFVGFESFREEDLEYVNKDSTVKDNDEAARILNDLGVDIYASFIVRPDFDKEDFAAMRRYCRQLELSFASFAVLTPLPGTDLYDEVKDEMLTHDTRYFDFLHTLLPTRLPLQEFYEELNRLYTTAIPLTKGLSFLAKYPLREIPATLAKSVRAYRGVRNAWRDYAPAA